jgi:hypothetical protein
MRKIQKRVKKTIMKRRKSKMKQSSYTTRINVLLIMMMRNKF